MSENNLYRCTLENNSGETKVKFCLYFKGAYYDILTLKKYLCFDKNFFSEDYRVTIACALDENKLDNHSLSLLQKRKNDLINRINRDNSLEYTLVSEDDMFSNIDKVSFVLYYCSKIEFIGGKYKLSLIDEPMAGIMINDEVYDLLTKEKVKNIADGEIDLDFVYLSMVKVVPDELLDDEERLIMSLTLNEILLKNVDGGKSKVAVINGGINFSNN